jgi:hypothetical protein
MTESKNQISGTLTDVEFERQSVELSEFYRESDLPEAEEAAEIQKRFHPEVIEDFNDLACSLIGMYSMSDEERDRQLAELATFFRETSLTGDALEAEIKKKGFEPFLVNEFRASV